MCLTKTDRYKISIPHGSILQLCGVKKGAREFGAVEVGMLKVCSEQISTSKIGATSLPYLIDTVEFRIFRRVRLNDA